MSDPGRSRRLGSLRRTIKEHLPRRPYYLASTAVRSLQSIPSDCSYRRSASPDGLSTPLPPPYLRFRVSGIYDIADFHESGREGRAAFEAALRAIGREISEFDSVLDFGVGCGRILRWMEPLADRSSFAGSDIDRPAISWCRRHVPFAECTTNGELPPLSFPDGSFDLVYSHSVFTHLDQEHQAAWLHELRRVLRPGGVALITVHAGPAFEDAFATASQHDAAHAAEARTAWERDGFSFARTNQWRGVFPDFYGRSYQTEDYTARVWGEILPIAAYLPGAMRSSQDIVVLHQP